MGTLDQLYDPVNEALRSVAGRSHQLILLSLTTWKGLKAVEKPLSNPCDPHSVHLPSCTTVTRIQLRCYSLHIFPQIKETQVWVTEYTPYPELTTNGLHQGAVLVVYDWKLLLKVD